MEVDGRMNVRHVVDIGRNKQPVGDGWGEPQAFDQN
jgi:hypothetical protein